MNAKVLVVDDDTALAEMIGIVLRSEGFEPSFCADGSEAVAAFHSARPDLVLLDLMLPGMDGIEVCSRIREESGIPIIMLTAKSDTTDVVKGLESGADDYIVKPFNPKELVARIRTRLRPASTSATGSLAIGDLTLDVAGHEVRRGDELLGIEGLDDVVVGAALEALDDIRGVAFGREHDDRDSRLLANARADLDAVNAGKHKVEKNQVRLRESERLDSASAVGAEEGLEPFGAQHDSDHLRKSGVVVDYKNFGVHSPLW